MPTPEPASTPSQVALPFHELLILWIIEHPGEPLKNAAALFGVTPHWVYTLSGSNFFKARLAEVMRERNIGSFVADLQAKIAGVTEHAVDKLALELEKATDTKTIFEIAKLLLEQRRGPSLVVDARTQSVTQNLYQMDARTAAVAKARRELLDRAHAEVAARPPLDAGAILAPPMDLSEYEDNA